MRKFTISVELVRLHVSENIACLAPYLRVVVIEAAPQNCFGSVSEFGILDGVRRDIGHEAAIYHAVLGKCICQRTEHFSLKALPKYKPSGDRPGVRIALNDHAIQQLLSRLWYKAQDVRQQPDTMMCN
ncbi:hypothetical protein DLJ82_2742 [Rhizobium leguminosarum]|uniref:Uncharacterized protein n=1 Tax=Rhizobium leguminosarum TaxID=384 RepID=A0A2Z4YG66_RHILE|nr:hypothetical protein DLJ82_2742 [Rhizobium leguminosarum]